MFFIHCKRAILTFVYGRIIGQWMYFGDAILAGNFRFGASRSIIQLTPKLVASGTSISTRRKRGSVALKFIHWIN
ncbi:MAG: hypothetical protein COA78_19190 [Blastopirellula sp.]|nr:MAG: hypothetical protein COA78_19190 [Blastopirellula sp.]